MLIVHFYSPKTPNGNSAFSVFVVVLGAPDRSLVVVVLPVIQVFQQLAELIFLFCFGGGWGWAVMLKFLYLGCKVICLDQMKKCLLVDLAEGFFFYCIGRQVLFGFLFFFFSPVGQFQLPFIPSVV